jgi:hypothetical protein
LLTFERIAETDYRGANATGLTHPALAFSIFIGTARRGIPVLRGSAPRFAIFSIWQYSTSRY